MVKGVILAAGKSQYYAKGHKPVCLFNCNGAVLLKNTVTLLRKYGIKDILVVVGYKANAIIHFSKRSKLNLEFTHRKTFAKEWAISSFLHAMKCIDKNEEIVLCTGDALLQEQSVKKLMNCVGKICMGVRTSRRGNSEFVIAKFKLKDLDNGNLNMIRNKCKKYRGSTKTEFQIGFATYLIRKGAVVVDKKMFDIDTYGDYKRWKCH